MEHLYENLAYDLTNFKVFYLFNFKKVDNKVIKKNYRIDNS